MKKHRANYRTSDGSADYQFSIEEQRNGTWKAFIEHQPSYEGLATDDHSTHRLSSGGRKHVCWDRQLKSLDDAKSVAAAWADKTQEYIKTGRKF